MRCVPYSLVGVVALNPVRDVFSHDFRETALNRLWSDYSEVAWLMEGEVSSGVLIQKWDIANLPGLERGSSGNLGLLQ